MGDRSPQPGHGTPVSFDFKEADVRGVLRMLAGVSGKEIIVTDDVHGSLTLKLDGVPWDEALGMIARTLDLSVERLGNVIRITSKARAEADQEAREHTELLHTELFPLRFARAATVADMLTGERERNVSRLDTGPGVTLYPDEAYATGVLGPSRGVPMQRPYAGAQRSGVLSPRGSALADEPSNTLIVTDVQRGVEAVRQIVAQIDRPAPQVVIESRIVEVRDDFERALGIQWGYRYVASRATGNPTGFNFPGTVAVGGAANVPGGSPGLNSGIDPVTGALIPFMADFPAAGAFGPGMGSALDLVLGSIDKSQLIDVRLSQLEDEGKLKIVSRPRIVTRNNQEAVIKAVDVIRVRLPASTVIGGYAVGVATQSIESGVALRVRPQISGDGYVLLDMRAISSSLGSRLVDNIPIQQERETESHVLLRDGQTLVVGGIYRIQNQVSWAGIPFLQAVPGLGWLFGSVTNQNERQDLVIFVTPRRLASPVAASETALPPAHQLWLNRSASGG